MVIGQNLQNVGDQNLHFQLAKFCIFILPLTLYCLSILEEFGNQLKEPYSKPVGDGIFELRVSFANDITRIFYFLWVGRRIILTNGFIKKTQKTPRNMIELAKSYKKDYENRFNEGGKG